MHTAKTQSVRQPQRNRFFLRPIAYYRHYGPAAWIDPVVLRAITISWNNIIIPGSWPYHHGHPDDKPHPWFTNDFGLPRMGCGIKRPQVTQHQGRSESERYGHYPHASASLPQTLCEVRYRDAIREGVQATGFALGIADADIGASAMVKTAHPINKSCFIGVVPCNALSQRLI